MILPADHPEAIAYLKKEAMDKTPEVPPNDQEDTPHATDAPPLIDAGPSKPKNKPPPRRKPRQSLEAMSAALDKGKKMTTLEKVSNVLAGSYLVIELTRLVANGLEKAHGWGSRNRRRA